MGHGRTEGARTPPAGGLDRSAATAVASTMQALSTTSRVLILTMLRDGPQTVGAVAHGVAMEQSAVSHQLRILRQLGLVVGERAGRSIEYSLYDDHVAQLLDEAVFHAEHLGLSAPDRTSIARPQP